MNRKYTLEDVKLFGILFMNRGNYGLIIWEMMRESIKSVLNNIGMNLKKI